MARNEINLIRAMDVVDVLLGSMGPAALMKFYKGLKRTRRKYIPFAFKGHLAWTTRATAIKAVERRLGVA